MENGEVYSRLEIVFYLPHPQPPYIAVGRFSLYNAGMDKNDAEMQYQVALIGVREAQAALTVATDAYNAALDNLTEAVTRAGDAARALNEAESGE
jgi:predicted transglutaminase-like cysteine proteinase